ncbi:MAG: hypothetical protein ACTSUT_08185 [Promethearchaeota archaeon]
MDNLKDAFNKVKTDILSLREEINFLKVNLFEMNEKIIEIFEVINKIKINKSKENLIFPSTNNQLIPTNTKDTSTHKPLFNTLKPQNIPISIGNEGVKTDRQTDRQTDKPTINSIEEAVNILDSLDNLKKEIRLKFKRLTNQEILVFSTIYQLDEEIGYSNYKLLSQRLNLTESSIRDYVCRILKKGIPVDKIKINNKNIQFKISSNLKKIATLPTILQLREL